MALFDSQVVRLDVFLGVFEVDRVDWMYSMKLIIYAGDKSEYTEQTVSV